MAGVSQLEGENSWNEIHVSLSTPGKNLVVYHCSGDGNKLFLPRTTNEPQMNADRDGNLNSRESAKNAKRKTANGHE
jgi:hypothetical protein